MNLSKCKQLCALPAMMAVMLILSYTGKAQTVTVTYNTPGTYTLTVPCGAANIQGLAWGGGGGGGGASAKGYKGIGNYVAAAASGGGGQGCYTSRALNSGSSYTIVVGAGGAGGVQNGSTLVQGAQDGGTSAIVGLSYAFGGSGAQSIYTYSNGLNDEGGRVTDGGTPNSSCLTAASGASGSMSNAAWNGTAPTNIYGGAGGGSTANGGQCGSSNGAFPGQPGTNVGGGGGGGATRSNDNTVNSANGGAGANGRIIINFDLSLSITGGAVSYCEGDVLTLNIADPCAATYVWKRNGVQVGTGTKLVITGLTVAHSGNYTVETVINTSFPGGSVTSSGLPAGITSGGTSLNGTLVSAALAVTVTSSQTGPIYRAPNLKQ